MPHPRRSDSIASDQKKVVLMQILHREKNFYPVSAMGDEGLDHSTIAVHSPKLAEHARDVYVSLNQSRRLWCVTGRRKVSGQRSYRRMTRAGKALKNLNTSARRQA